MPQLELSLVLDAVVIVGFDGSGNAPPVTLYCAYR
jgi:hypothetical protein